jgi:hypothetical protein
VRFKSRRVFVRKLNVRRHRRRVRRRGGCIVATEKITQYLLNLDHSDGAGKAKFFIGGGFSPDEPEALAEALKRHFRENMPTEHKPDRFGGERLVIDAPMGVPDGRSPMVRSVWGIDKGQAVARLLTAHPLD